MAHSLNGTATQTIQHSVFPLPMFQQKKERHLPEDWNEKVVAGGNVWRMDVVIEENKCQQDIIEMTTMSRQKHDWQTTLKTKR